ncbi:MAG: hypothetical protein V4850_32185 [Myxococcota bacterium]
MWLVFQLLACVDGSDPEKVPNDTGALSPDLGPWDGMIYVDRGRDARYADAALDWVEYPPWGMGEFRAEPYEAPYAFGYTMGGGEGCVSPTDAGPDAGPDRISVGPWVSLWANGEEAIFNEEIWSMGPEYWAHEGLPAPFAEPGFSVTFADATGTTVIPEDLVFDASVDDAVHGWHGSGSLDLSWVPAAAPGARVGVNYYDNAGTSVICAFDDDGAERVELPTPDGTTPYILTITRTHATRVESPTLGTIQLGVGYVLSVTGG